MENFHSERFDRWREAILKEREYPDKRAPMLEQALKEYQEERDKALVLGDASLVQSNILLEKEHFKYVVDVDSSPSLMDDDIVKNSDERLERVLKRFDEYTPAKNSFDLIYGKSIAFNPKETTPRLLKDLADALTENGLFYSEWGGVGDSYRHDIEYSEEELENLYEDVQLKIIKKEVIDEPVVGLLGRSGRNHYIAILARKVGL